MPERAEIEDGAEGPYYVPKDTKAAAAIILQKFPSEGTYLITYIKAPVASAKAEKRARATLGRAMHDYTHGKYDEE